MVDDDEKKGEYVDEGMEDAVEGLCMLLALGGVDDDGATVVDFGVVSGFMFMKVDVIGVLGVEWDSNLCLDFDAFGV